jgi:HEAT repeat protein
MEMFNKSSKPNIKKMIQDMAIDQLAEAYKHENQNISKQSEDALLNITDSILVMGTEKFDNLYKSKNITAIQTLAKIASLNELPCNSTAKIAAIHTLVKFKENKPLASKALDEVFTTLTKCLKNRSDAADAAKTFIALGEPAVKPLINTLKEPSFILPTAQIGYFVHYGATALAEIGEPAIKPLIQALESNNKYTCWWAMEALKEIVRFNKSSFTENDLNRLEMTVLQKTDENGHSMTEKIYAARSKIMEKPGYHKKKR